MPSIRNVGFYQGWIQSFQWGGAKTSGQNAPLHFFLYKFFQKVDPLKICVSKSDKQKQKRDSTINTIKPNNVLK